MKRARIDARYYYERWWWFVFYNHDCIAEGVSGYSRKSDALRAAKRAKALFQTAEVVTK